MQSILNHWHTMLDMPKYDETWHRKDIEDELDEYHNAYGIIDTWSELSDVAYTYTRAHWSGHHTIVFPLSRTAFFIGVLYMIPKYTLRWRFFRMLGKRIRPDLAISAVRNPRKVEKLDSIAQKYDIDPILFRTEAEKLMKRRFLLK